MGVGRLCVHVTFVGRVNSAGTMLREASSANSRDSNCFISQSLTQVSVQVQSLSFLLISPLFSINSMSPVPVLFTINSQTEGLEKCETLAQLWGDSCLWLFHLAAVTGSSYSFWAGIHLFMCDH